MIFKNRNLTSIILGFSFVATAITGLLYFFGIKSQTIEVVHILFGLLFVIFCIIHIVYNFKSLSSYILNKKTSNIRKETVIGLSVCFILFLIMCSGLEVVSDIANSGKRLFAKEKEPKRPGDGLNFSEISTNENIKGTELHLIIRKNEEVIAPSFVIWVINSENQYVETLFLPSQRMVVPASVIHLKDFDKPSTKDAIFYLDFDILSMPKFHEYNPDKKPNYIGATPINSFILTTNTRESEEFTIYMEVRHKNKTELYHAFVIKSGANNVFLFQSTQNTFIKEAFVRTIPSF